MASHTVPGINPWSYAIRGVLGILVGLYMLIAPGIGLLAFVLAYGVFSLVDGIIAAAASFAARKERGVDWALLLGGILGIVVGLLFLFRPLLSIGAMSLLIAIWMIAVGISTIVSAIYFRKQIKGEWLLVIASLFPIGFGLFLLVRPILAVALLPFMIGSYAFLWGALMLAAAFSLWGRKSKVPAEPGSTTP